MGVRRGGLDDIHVCSLNDVHGVIRLAGARHLVTCLADGGLDRTPEDILSGRHLKLVMHDVEAEQAGYVAPSAEHVANLIEFVVSWDRNAPMLIHCFAGISRSTAAAYVALCALNPKTPENFIAQYLRRASPAATPNRRIVALADAALGRGGRMCDAAELIGRGQMELARPFALSARMG
jgi:predicted protein tyrosine phosphatase